MGFVLIACGNGNGTSAPSDASTSTTQDTGPMTDAPTESALPEAASLCDSGMRPPGAPLGAPCVSGLESDPSFAGFFQNEINVQTKDFQCDSKLCLINHFQGRVTCPYGQDSNGNGPSGVPGCLTLGTCAPVVPNDPIRAQTVPAQCVDGPPASAVYCSCRCANADGTVDDAGTYCSCPSGMTCTQLVASIGGVNDTLSGAYCIKTGTAFNKSMSCSKLCNPTTAPCP
jgi:hypothetical protein